MIGFHFLKIYLFLIALNDLNARSIQRRNSIEINKQTYLLISTSSKIYCMQMPTPTTNVSNNENYEIIYEEKKLSNNWITDAFYIKSEDLIYVNVYNSTSSSSNIFTLNYDKQQSVWIKKTLYSDQSYCLGIAYNEDLKELYWTASKSIMAGSSINSNKFRVLFNLDAAKKLLYLKYDKISDTIYVSTLNYVYACSLKQQTESGGETCRIIIRDLVSARGLYLDTINRDLYVVDHKKKKIEKVKLNDEPDSVSTLISADTIPDIGDVFYMCIENRSNSLIWSEFSGKIKVSSLNDISNYKLLFSTNEYTYSISIMDNSTYSVNYIETTTIPTTSTTTTTTTSTTTTTTTTTTTEMITTTNEIINISHDSTRPIRTLTMKSRNSLSTSNILETTTTTTESIENINSTTTVISNINENDLIFKTKETEAEFKAQTPEIILESNNKITKSYFLNQQENENNNNKLVSKSDVNLKKQISLVARPVLINTTENSRILSKKNYETKSIESAMKSNDFTKMSYNYLRSTHLNVALYVVICLLCFSLIINIILLYISKIKYSKNNNKLMVSRENCSNKGSSISKSSKIDSDEHADFNINLISSQGNTEITTYSDQ